MPRLIRSTRTLAGALLPADTAHTAAFPWDLQEAAGRFACRDDGCSVERHPEAIEYVTSGGDADHGVRIALGAGREIVAYADYTVFVAGDGRPCQRNRFPWKSGSTGRIFPGLLGSRSA